MEKKGNKHKHVSFLARNFYDTYRGYGGDPNSKASLKKNVRHCARNSFKEWKERIQNLRLISDEQKATLMPLLQRHILWVAFIEYLFLERAVVAMGTTSLIIMSLGFILGIVFPQYGDLLTYGPWLLLIAVSIGVTVSATVVSHLSLEQLDSYLIGMVEKRGYWWIGLFFYFSAVYIDPGYPPQFKTSFGWLSGLVAATLGFASGAWFHIHGFIWLYNSIQRDKNGRRPQSFVVEGYLRMLIFLDDHPTFLERSKTVARRHFMALVEDTAIIIERDFWRSLQSSDPNTDAWTKGKASRIANSLRGMKKWVIVPKEDTFHQLRCGL